MPNQQQISDSLNIEVLGFKRLENSGSLRAFVSVRIGKTIVHDFRVVQQQGQRAFVQPPIRSWLENGKTKYGGPIIELPKQSFSEVSSLILTEWQQENRED